MNNDKTFTTAETGYCDTIRSKDAALRKHLDRNALSADADPIQWLTYLADVKAILGNLNNDVSFVATLLIKNYLRHRFSIINFDAAGKPQGAAGIDVQAVTADGKTIIGELKTTTPYQPGFGAAQRTTILKDLMRLATTQADHRFMFVTDPDAFKTICGKSFASRIPGVEIVDLVTGSTFACPAVE